MRRACPHKIFYSKGFGYLRFSVCVSEGQDKLPTMYWLHKLHKRPYKARFITNSSSCTTTELSKLMTSCVTDTKSHVIHGEFINEGNESTVFFKKEYLHR